MKKSLFILFQCNYSWFSFLGFILISFCIPTCLRSFMESSWYPFLIQCPSVWLRCSAQGTPAQSPGPRLAPLPENLICIWFLSFFFFFLCRSTFHIFHISHYLARPFLSPSLFSYNPQAPSWIALSRGHWFRGFIGPFYSELVKLKCSPPFLPPQALT